MHQGVGVIRRLGITMSPQLCGKWERQVKYLPHSRVCLHGKGCAHSADVDRPDHLDPFLSVLSESGDPAWHVNAEPGASPPVASFVTAWQVAIDSSLIHRLHVLNRTVRAATIRRASIFRAGFGSVRIIRLRLIGDGFRPEWQLRCRPRGPAAEPVVVVCSLADAVEYGECLTRPPQRCFDFRELVGWYQAGEVIRCSAQHCYSFPVRCCDLVSIG